MDALIIEGPAKLKGEVKVSGSKNACLPLLFASLLFDEEVRFENVPRLWDIETTLSLLSDMGCKTNWQKEEGIVSILPTVKKREASYDWVKKMRAGILALGPMTAKYGEAKVSLPGGCAIGARPVNFHIEALRKMGAVVEVEEGYIHAKVSSLKGATVSFPEVSVTGTENILMVAVLAEGKTCIENAACEPEVVALGEFLLLCGAKIEGLGTSRIEVTGGKLKAPTKSFPIPPDRIEAGTWISVAVATGSELTLNHVDAKEMGAVLQAFEKMGVKFDHLSASSFKVIPQKEYSPIHLETEPYPGFPTDMQAQMIVAMLKANGKSTIRENIFENRFMHVAELRRLGAKIEVEGSLATISGNAVLNGAPIMATDLRASASLVVAALCSKGTTKISRIYHLDRGYQRLDEKLSRLGAVIRRVAE